MLDEGAYTAYKLNCHKKKRKVENLIQLYDKDSVNTLQDRDIYQQKLSEISSAALGAAVYIEDLIDQLEVNGEEARITELNDIKKHIFSIVKKNEKEVKEEMQSIVDRAEAASAEAFQGVTPTTTPPQPLTAADLQNAIAGLVIPAHSDTNGAVHGARRSPKGVDFRYSCWTMRRTTLLCCRQLAASKIKSAADCASYGTRPGSLKA